MNPQVDAEKASGKGMGSLFPSCREASRLQSEALDRPLTFFQRLGLWFHLLICRWCRRYGKQIAFLRSTAHKCGEEEKHLPAQTLPEDAKERMKEAIRRNKGSC